MSSCKLRACSLSTYNLSNDNHSRVPHEVIHAAGEAEVLTDCSVVSTEEVAHIDIGLFLFFFLLLYLGGRGVGSSSGGSGSGEGSSGRLEGLSLREAVVGSEGHGSEVLEGVDDEVGHSRGDNVARAKGSSGHVGGAGGELGEDVLGLDGQDLSVVDFAIIVNFQDVHLEFERHDLQLIEKSSLGGGDLIAFLDNLHRVDNINLSLHNLGLDGKGLEELSLLGIKSSGTRGDSHIRGSNGTDLGGGSSHLSVNDLLDSTQISVGEDEADVADELRSDQSEVGSGLPGGLFLLVVLHAFLGLGDELIDSSLHEGL